MADFTVSTDIDTFLQSADNAAARGSLGAINYPYTTDFQSGVEQTRNLTTITSSDGYLYSSVTSIYVGSNVTSIGSRAFYFSTLSSATISSGVTSLGSYCFSFCPLTSVIIPDSVTSIGTRAFEQCSSLTSATIGNSVTSLGSECFAFCSNLTSIIIPDSVTSIGFSAFGSCTNLATINCFALAAPLLGATPFSGIAATDIHVPVGATGYGTTYGGLTVVADL